MKASLKFKPEVKFLNKGKKVAVGLSGGVDSSVSTALLVSAGYEVIGVNMKCWSNADGRECEADKDRKIAIQVAEKLGIEVKVWDFEKEYRQKVIDYFYKEFEAGRTPNPDIICNKEIKFGMFLDRAIKDLGVDFVATGHYARVVKDDEVYRLLKGVDDSKDQSYFLHTLNQYQLAHSIFPVGHLLKKEVREIAKEYDFANYDKPDSVGICFVGDVDIKEFLKQRIDVSQGEVVTTSGEVIGTHDGVWFYTIGQRRGFDITKYQGKPLYVIGKDIKNNKLIVGDMVESNKIEFPISNLYLIAEDYKKMIEKELLDIRIRHLGGLVKGKVDDNKVIAQDGSFFQGVASGQSAVFYKDDFVLGGAIIEE
ncbi:MAG: tRNA 2-thiouridine(34) synthase MnmA [Candidatus Pacebacteria bacterium]|nr:tRNA 2-thiouridine(34) synthase MnmA [Candidatus Paceibacterota bacterium]